MIFGGVIFADAILLKPEALCQRTGCREDVDTERTKRKTARNGQSGRHKKNHNKAKQTDTKREQFTVRPRPILSAAQSSSAIFSITQKKKNQLQVETRIPQIPEKCWLIGGINMHQQRNHISSPSPMYDRILLETP